MGAEGATALAAVLKETQITNLGCATSPRTGSRVFALVSAPADTPDVSPSPLLACSLGRNNLTNNGEDMSGVLKLVEILPMTKIESLGCAAASKCSLLCQRPLTPSFAWQFGQQPALRRRQVGGRHLHRRGHHQAVRGTQGERRDLARVRHPERLLSCQRPLTLLCLLPLGSVATVLAGTTTMMASLLPPLRASLRCARGSREAL